MRYLFIILIGILSTSTVFGQDNREIPSVYSNIHYDENGKMYAFYDGRKVYEFNRAAFFKLENIKGNPQGTAEGINLDFNDAALEGILYYGFIPYGDSKHPMPVYFKMTSPIKGGKAKISIKKNLSGRYDMIGWSKTGKGTLGYRIVTKKGTIIYDGKISFKGKGPFTIDTTIIEGPFVTKVDHNKASIFYTTNLEVRSEVKVGDKVFSKNEKTKIHELEISGLEGSKEYQYEVLFGDNIQTYSFRTAPIPGSRSSFTFAYASDSRNGAGGGERNVYGTNMYIMKKIGALASFKESSFMQFSGDLIDGYLIDDQEMDLQYANWKRSIEPYGHYLPIYISMGNHEALVNRFKDDKMYFGISVDKWPFETKSAEAVFSRNFCNPMNGPESEDGNKYDPQTEVIDFPSYNENVFHYRHDNVAMIVLNSDYFYSPGVSTSKSLSGNVHGYIMDNQLKWFEDVLDLYEKDTTIDHVFVTLHTPFFPNGGHVKDDMWYGGKNEVRGYVKGVPFEKGIIERRDDLLDLIVNKHKKPVAILTGDEHNYAKTEIGPSTNIYPNNYGHSTLELSRTIFQVNNGAAGAPYYAQEQTPWSASVSGFTTQNALVFFHINGAKVAVEVLNPDTLELIENYNLR